MHTHTWMQSGFLQYIYRMSVCASNNSHSWGNVQHHFFLLKCVHIFFRALSISVSHRLLSLILSVRCSACFNCHCVCVLGGVFFFRWSYFSVRKMEWKLYILYFMYGVIFMAVVALVVLVCVHARNVFYFWLVVTNDGYGENALLDKKN